LIRPRAAWPLLIVATRGAAAASSTSPDGSTLAAASYDRSVVLWDLSDREHPRRLGQPLTGYASEVTEVAFAPDGNLLAAGSYDTIVLYDLADRGDPKRLGHPSPAEARSRRLPSPPTAARLSPAGGRASTSGTSPTEASRAYSANPRFGQPPTSQR
jgi:WD40 repeat protein